ncbi:hypothetical protein B7R22_14890, partial [Subtercola boreus]
MTIEVGGGSLDITVPGASVDLGSVAVSAAAQTVSAPLGAVTVSDTRGGVLGWTATAGATDFTGPQNISVSGVGTSSYTSPNAATTGASDVAASNLTALYPAAPVQTASGVNGINTATWVPVISVVLVNGQWFVPMGGQRKCPLVAMKSARVWPTVLPTWFLVVLATAR